MDSCGKSRRNETDALRFEYDPEADAASIYLREPIERGEVVRSDVAELSLPMASVVYSFDRDDRLVLIEILGARELLPFELLQKRS